MIANAKISKALSRIIDEKLRRGQLSPDRSPAVTIPTVTLPPPQTGDNYEQAGVTGIRTDGNPYLSGDITLNGSKGASLEQSGQEILLIPPKVRHFSNPRTPLSSVQMGALVLNSIHLFPFEPPGWLLLKSIFFQVDKDGTPDDQAEFLEIGVYKRNDANDGFTRELQVGPLRFNDSTLLSGFTRYYRLSVSSEIPAGQHFLAILYKYSGAGGYLFAQCQSAGMVYPGSGVYLLGVASSLPSTILDSDFSSYLSALPWLDLEGE